MNESLGMIDKISEIDKDLNYQNLQCSFLLALKFSLGWMKQKRSKAKNCCNFFGYLWEKSENAARYNASST